MKILINNKKLLNALKCLKSTNKLDEVCYSSDNVNLIINKNILILYITNSSIFLKTSITISSDLTLSAMLPIDTFIKILSKIYFSENIHLGFEPLPHPNHMFISSLSHRFMLPCFPISSFFHFKNNDYVLSFCLKSYDIFSLISTIYHALPRGNSKFSISGIYAHITHPSCDNQRLNFVATDMHRLATGSISISKNFKYLSGFILPNNTIFYLMNLFKIHRDLVMIRVSTRNILFKFSTITLVSKLIDARFPEYASIFPNVQYSFRISGRILLNTLNLVRSVSRFKTVVLKLQIKYNKLLLKISEKNNFGAVSKLYIDYKGPSFSIFINSQYLSDILNNIFEDHLYFKFSNLNSAFLITDSSKYKFNFLIMPMQS